MWWPIPQLGSASPPLQPSLTTALLSKCQSEPPGLLCISILALVGLFIPCPRDADSLHSASAAAEFRVGWSTRVHLHRPFITIHLHPPKQGTGCSFPAGTRGWRCLVTQQTLPQCSGRAAPPQPLHSMDASLRERRRVGESSSGGA